MGFGPWAYLNGRRLGDFDAVMGAFHPATVYQNYVGLGWWLATRPVLARPRATAAVAGQLHHRFRLLPYEGIGFRAGFLGAGRTTVTRTFAAHGRDRTHVCFQGYGRSLWFVCMGDLGRAAALIGALPAGVRGDCWSGLGLGYAYSWLDRADALDSVIAAVPLGARPDFRQGAAFGWEARQLADRQLFDSLTGRLDPALRDYIAASLAAVARTRDDLDERGVRDSYYQAWRAGTRERLPDLP
jgi:enediyne biosynthesis protein E3